AISASGMPHRPKPPTAIVWPSATTPARAAAALGYTLLIDVLVWIVRAPAAIIRAATIGRRRGLARRDRFHNPMQASRPRPTMTDPHAARAAQAHPAQACDDHGPSAQACDGHGNPAHGHDDHGHPHHRV